MDESLEYEKMIEIPLSSCEYVHRRRHRFLKKRKLIKEINQKIADPCADCLEAGECLEFCAEAKNVAGGEAEAIAGFSGESGENFNEFNESRAINAQVKSGDKSKLVLFKSFKRADGQDKIIAAQIAAAFLLVVAIILTNVFWENSGMNVLLKSAFGTSQEQTDNRVYSDFSLNLPVRGEGLTYTEGVINVNGESFIYPVCDGTISQIQKGENGKYTVTVAHSDSFKSVIEGADFVCFEAGDSVNARVPLCHTEGGASIYLYDNGSLLTQYAAKEDSIVWTK